ncbi:MAG: exodeoxyribonuclease VII small subunit [Lachnospiraceae bacterium]|jgi:exodeoxyribonuclease VII small subunit|nr:exodeoxyribonuclease VII small subunit [Lachnospiraceae bacterium]MBR3574417.1 exodeoxyribonuclease VII small subunit [Lachnospiraceae bacterium]MCR5739946.1 exodeoxyribonuclease VII small subunit [Lachnospiraceae bacterium]
MAAKSAKETEERELTLEENFDLLEEVTERLQSDDLPLEEAFENYKKGMDLIKKCSEQIDMVEKEVLKLNSDMSVESM